jgi:hypothetical protein
VAAAAPAFRATSFDFVRTGFRFVLGGRRHVIQGSLPLDQLHPFDADRTDRKKKKSDSPHSDKLNQPRRHCVVELDPDRLDEAQLDDLRRELASMSEAALACTYETYRMACGLRKDGLPRPATMQCFWQVWEECRRRLASSCSR